MYTRNYYDYSDSDNWEYLGLKYEYINDDTNE